MEKQGIREMHQSLLIEVDMLSRDSTGVIIVGLNRSNLCLKNSSKKKRLELRKIFSQALEALKEEFSVDISAESFYLREGRFQNEAHSKTWSSSFKRISPFST